MSTRGTSSSSSFCLSCDVAGATTDEAAAKAKAIPTPTMKRAASAATRGTTKRHTIVLQ
jgi:hypothetical protein